LSPSCNKVRKCAIWLIEIDVYMERLSGIDLESASRTIVWISKLINVILPTRTTTVTIVVKSRAARIIAFMSSCLPSPLICFHNIKLWTIITINLVSITVVIAVCVPKLTSWVFTRHAYKVKSSDAPTITFGKINIIRNWSSKKIWSEKRVWIKLRWFRKITSIIIRDSHCAVVRFWRGHSHVQSFLYSIYRYLKGSVAILWLMRCYSKWCYTSADEIVL